MGFLEILFVMAAVGWIVGVIGLWMKNGYVFYVGSMMLIFGVIGGLASAAFRFN